MPAALDTVSFSVTAPGATITATTAVTGDSLTVRNSLLTAPVYLLNHWAWNVTAGIMQVRSPKLHDNVRGLRKRVLANSVEVTEAIGAPQKMFPQDTLIVELSGGGAGEIDTGSMLFYYTDLPGQAAALIDVPTLQKRIVNLFTVEVPVTTSGSAGYSGGVAINSSFDFFQANTWYAILGALVDARCASVCIRGADTGNLRVSVPGETTRQDVTSRWFVLLSHYLNLPLIPLINSANKAGTIVDILGNNTATTSNVNVIMAQLSPT